MNIWTYIPRLITASLICLPTIANALTMDFPALDIQNNTGGVTLTDTQFNINATAFSIVDSNLNAIVDIPDQPFTLTSTGTINSATIFGDVSTNFSGTFIVGGGLLNGSFSGLTVGHYDGVNGDFQGIVSFDGGSLAGGLTSGKIIGEFIIGSSVDAKIGAVVPVPAAVWLFGSGILGLIAVARRKTA